MKEEIEMFMNALGKVLEVKEDTVHDAKVDTYRCDLQKLVLFLRKHGEVRFGDKIAEDEGCSILFNGSSPFSFTGACGVKGDFRTIGIGCSRRQVAMITAKMKKR